MSTRYQAPEDTDRVTRALYRIRPLPAALLLRISVGAPRQPGDVTSAVSLAGRYLVKPFESGYAGAYELTALGAEAVAQIHARVAARVGLAKVKPQTAQERAIAHSFGFADMGGIRSS